MVVITRLLSEAPSSQKLGSSGVRIIRNRVLLAPGTWNGKHYSAEEIKMAFENTDWEGSYASSLVADHNDDETLKGEMKVIEPEGRPLTLKDWLGFITNQHLDERGFLIGDLNLCDSGLAMKLIEGNAPFGVSAYVQGMSEDDSERNFIFKNFAIVVTPGCKESFINDKLSEDKLNETLDGLSVFERIRKRLDLDVVEFYAVPKNPENLSQLPMFDKLHTQNSMNLFDETKLLLADKVNAGEKLICAAKKFGIEYEEFSKLVETRVGDVSGSKKELNGLQPIKTKKKKKSKSSKDVLTELKGGKKNIEKMEKLEEEKKEEVEEEKEEAKEEPVKEESKEEAAPAEEAPVEETEEKLLDNIAKMTEKLLSKRKRTPEQERMEKLEENISGITKAVEKLSSAVKKLQEEPEEKTEVSEKLSANPRTRASTKLSEDIGFSFGGKQASEGSKELASMLGY